MKPGGVVYRAGYFAICVVYPGYKYFSVCHICIYIVAGVAPWLLVWLYPGGVAQSRRLWRAYTVEAGGRPAGAVVVPWRASLAPGRRLWL